MPIYGIDGRRATDWQPIITAARELLDVARNDGDGTALGGALGRLLMAVPPPLLVQVLMDREAMSS